MHKIMAHLFYSNTWTPLKGIRVEVYQIAAGSYYCEKTFFKTGGPDFNREASKFKLDPRLKQARLTTNMFTSFAPNKKNINENEEIFYTSKDLSEVLKLNMLDLQSAFPNNRRPLAVRNYELNSPLTSFMTCIIIEFAIVQIMVQVQTNSNWSDK